MITIVQRTVTIQPAHVNWQGKDETMSLWWCPRGEMVQVCRVKVNQNWCRGLSKQVAASVPDRKIKFTRGLIRNFSRLIPHVVVSGQLPEAAHTSCLSAVSRGEAMQKSAEEYTLSTWAATVSKSVLLNLQIPIKYQTTVFLCNV